MQRNRIVKGLLGGLLMVAMLLSFLPTLLLPGVATAAATTWDVYEGQSIQAAIDGASAGDTVFVHAGTYVLPTISEFRLCVGTPNITLKGEGAGVVTLDSGGTGVAICIGLVATAPGCIVEGFRIVNSSKGISVRGGSPDCIIRNNVIEVYTLPVDTSAPNTTIIGNVMTYGGFIDLTSSNNTFMNNVLDTSGTAAIYLNFYNGNQIINNTISALQATDGAICVDGGSMNNISNNNITAGTGIGVVLFDSTANNTLTKNNISSSAVGLGLYYAGEENKIYLNNFFDNVVNVTTTCWEDTAPPPAVTYWDSPEPIEYTYNGATYTDYLGNYWGSAYSGSDANGNGIGDIPYTVPDSLGSDNYPLMGQYGVDITEPAPAVAPVAAFTSDVQSGTAPLTVNFTDASTNTPASWAWDFDNNGVVDSTAQNPSHIYTAAGTYTVKLTATNAGGSDDEVKTNYITVASPVPAWDLNGDRVCNIGDVVVIGLHWNETGTPGWIPQDLNNDAVINIGDVVVLGLHWGETW